MAEEVLGKLDASVLALHVDALLAMLEDAYRDVRQRAVKVLVLA